MKTLLILICGVVTFSRQDSELQDFIRGSNQFTAKVYKQVQESNSGNFLICPLSATVALSLTHAGARGNTAKELADGINIPNDKTRVQEIYQKLHSYLNINGQYILTSANKLYVANRFKLKDQFKSIVVNSFGADIQNINFTPTPQAATQINKWVEDQTHDKIKNLISPDQLNENTVTILINAMYFKATWLNQFDSGLTMKRNFFTDNGLQVPIDMMSLRTYIDFYDNGVAQFVRLPYEGNDVSMTIILPKQRNGLINLEDNIESLLGDPPYNSEDIDVCIPKFKIETKIDFVPILKKFGVNDAFNEVADFSDMGTGPLYISNVLQKTFIEVTEKGTTAAASTAVQIDDRISASYKFIADHPFMFYLKHKVAGVFFVGRFVNPDVSVR